MTRAIRSAGLGFLFTVLLAIAPLRAQATAQNASGLPYSPAAALLAVGPLCGQIMGVTAPNPSSPRLAAALVCVIAISFNAAFPQLMSLPGSSVAPAAAPPGQCGYSVIGPGLPHRTGGGVIFIPMGSATLVTFPEGQITFSGSGPGTYPVGAARGPGDAQGATLTLDDGLGGILPLSTADGGSSKYLNRNVALPPPATVTISAMDASQVVGVLDGVFFVSGQTASRQQFDHVQATVRFWAVGAAHAASCPP